LETNKNILNCDYFEFNLISLKMIASKNTHVLFLYFIQDVSKLTALSREVISRQATINIGEYA